ncbi:MAG: hypothetical protein WAX77_09650 [Methylococcaceae bacterium]
MEKRINFSSCTKLRVAERAGLRCSYPACNKLTKGPGAKKDETSNSGTVAHIYSAAIGGPRGRGDLSEKELKSIDNAIWLCRNHGTQIDNNRGDKYPPELLLGYKQMHESRIAHEHEGLYSPIGWIHKVEIDESPVFESQSSIILGKLNLISGDNDTGKSALCSWISGIFDVAYLEGWKNKINTSCPLKINLTYFAPDEIKISLEISDSNKILYKVNGFDAPTNPFKINLLLPRSYRSRLTDEEENDDIAYFSGILKVDPIVIESLAKEINK